MASQPSVYDEERNRLRLRAWEQRNQETSQAKEAWAENVPLFGHPYKTNKGDELSHRIQRMLGSFEDVNNPTDPPAAPAQSDVGQLNPDRSGKPSALDPDRYTSGPIPLCSSSAFQKMRENPSSPKQQQSLKSSLDHQKMVEPMSDPVENVQIGQESSAQSPDVRPILFPNPSEPVGALDSRQESTDPPSTSATADISALNARHSPAEPSSYQAGKSVHSLLSQSFPPLSSSKPPNAVVMQKPTAYVRPMDGQDLLLGGSPNVKPSSEPRAPSREILKSDNVTTKTLPQYLETKAGEVCVEDILKEMTHSWPPLLTAIHIPNSDGCLTKEAEQVSSCPRGQKSPERSPGDPCRLDTQSSSIFSHVEAHSSDVESASSSDSDSNPRSESDAESIVHEPGGLTASSKVEVSLPSETAAPRSDWQLGNWIQSAPKNSGSKGQAVPNVLYENSARKEPHGSNPPAPEATQPPERGGEPPKVQPCGSHERSSNGAPRKPACGTLKAPKDVVKSAEDLAAKAHSFSDRPKVKMKSGCPEKANNDSKRKRTLKVTDAKKSKSRLEAAQCKGRCPSFPHRCSCLIPPETPSVVVGKADEGVVRQAKSIPKAEGSKKSHKTSGDVPKSSQDTPTGPPRCLLVKIDLSLLSRIPRAPQDGTGSRKHPKTSKTTLPHTVSSNKLGVEMGDKNLPGKKRKLEKKISSNKDSSVKVKESSSQLEDQQHNKAKKKRVDVQKPPKNSGKDLKVHKGSGVEPPKDAPKRKESSKHKSGHAKHAYSEKKLSSSFQTPGETKSSRPLLKSENRRYPVKHYIKEAKRLKHKADAESDKRSKAFNYLDAAMFFVESGIGMEKDPHISTSSYTMFSETVELLKFVLKLINPTDMTAPPAQKDFVALCLKCQSLLQIAMFRHKYKTALKYSKMLTDHFNNPTQESSAHTKGPSTPSPMSSVPSPACGGSNAVALPVAVEQMTLSYVNITTLFLSAQEMWEQADQMAEKGSGLVADLDAAVGPLSLTSSMSAMVRYTQQGMAWLRLGK
ncbi:AF4/FMR2 family member 1-like [Stigmatopora argus]